jgi:hypothetical protein
MNRCWLWPCAAWIEALRTATNTNVLSCIVSFRWGREGWVTIRCSTRPVYSPVRHSEYSGGVARGTIGGCDIPELRFCGVHSLDAYRVNGDRPATSVGDRFCTFWLPVGRVFNATSAGTTPQCLSGHVMFRFNFRLFVSTPGKSSMYHSTGAHCVMQTRAPFYVLGASPWTLHEIYNYSHKLGSLYASILNRAVDGQIEYC